MINSMNSRMNFIAIALAFVCILFGNTPLAEASGVTISPLLVDLELEAREVTTTEVTLTNDTERKVVLFATVNEVAVDTTGEVKEFVSPVMTDRTNTVTSWLEITRGRIEIEPGETKKIPLTVRVHPYADFGEYFAFIGFVEAPKRPEAEAVALAGNANGVILKIDLADTRVESLRISGFLVDRFIINENKRGIEVEIENVGDTNTTPTGEIIFYNSRGEEVSSLPFNESKEEIAAGEKRVLVLEVPFTDKLGRFKANLALEYGNDQTATVFDTAQFFMIPLRIVVMSIFSIMAAAILITFLLRKIFYEESYDSEDGTVLPLYVRTDRDHNEKDHDIHITKN